MKRRTQMGRKEYKRARRRPPKVPNPPGSKLAAKYRKKMQRGLKRHMWA